MSKELKDLMIYFEENNSKVSKKLAMAVYKFSKDKNLKKLAQEILSDELEIDLFELESLVRPDKFDFPEPDIGLIGVKDEEVS